MTLIWDEKSFLVKQLGIKHLSLSCTWLAPEHQLFCCLATSKFNANFLYLSYSKWLFLIIFLKILNNELFNIPQKTFKCSFLPFHIQEFKCRKLYQWDLYHWAPKMICLLTLQESFLLYLKNWIALGGYQYQLHWGDPHLTGKLIWRMEHRGRQSYLNL